MALCYTKAMRKSDLKIEIVARNTLMLRFHVGFEIEIHTTYFSFLEIFLGNEPNSSEFTLSKSYWLVGGAMAIIRGWSHTPETYHNRIVFFTIMVLIRKILN